MHNEKHKTDFTSSKEAGSYLKAGKITKFLFNAHSEIDGFLLDNTQQVHICPHDIAELLKSIKLGENVKIQGVKSKTADLLFASSVTCENGAVIHIQQAPEKKKEASLSLV